jgi:hypothetical protein
LTATGNITALDAIPESWIAEAKSKLHIAYGTASHGQQICYGMACLDTWDGSTLYDQNNGGSGGALDFRWWSGAQGGFGALGIALSLDLAADTSGDRDAWLLATTTYLDAHPEINVCMWAWCSGLISGTEAQINTYLSRMETLEATYPNVKFVYMTAHSHGDGLTGNTHLRNQQIRNYCIANNKILYDFYDIECYDPDGTYFGDKNVDADCSYTTGNWATEWKSGKTSGVDYFPCQSQMVACHTDEINGNLKTVAAWHLFARLAGWEGV